MDQLFEVYVKQLVKRLESGKNHEPNYAGMPIDQIVIFCLGGVIVDNNLFLALLKDELRQPVYVLTDYDIPAYINQQTLVLFFGDTGNAEKTLHLLGQFIAKTAKIVCFGHEDDYHLRTFSSQHQIDLIQLPADKDFMANSTAYSVLILMTILAESKQINKDRLLENLRSLLNTKASENPSAPELARQIAFRVYGKKIILCGQSIIEPVLNQFNYQLKRIAKHSCRYFTLTEYTDHELNVLIGEKEKTALIFLKNQDMNDVMERRIRQIKKSKLQTADTLVEIESKGINAFQEIIHLIHLTDLVAWHLDNTHTTDEPFPEMLAHVKKLQA